MRAEFNKVVGIVGPRRSGKSYLAAEMFALEDQVAVYCMIDPRDYNVRATEIIMDGDRKPHEKLEAALREERFRVAFTIADLERDERDRDRHVWLPPFCAAVWERGDMTVVFDEMHRLCKAGWCPPELSKMIQLGGNRRLDIIWVSQRLAGVWVDLRAATDEFIFFRIHDPRDLDAIAERAGAEVADQVAELKRIELVNGKVAPGDTLWWNAMTGEVKINLGGEAE